MANRADSPGASRAVPDEADEADEKEILELLKALPPDVLGELNLGRIDVRDPAFLEGLADHLSRLALADPRQGRHWLGKLNKLKKHIRRNLRVSQPEVITSETLTRVGPRAGRNDPCPCGSGRKFKQCCLRQAPS